MAIMKATGNKMKRNQKEKYGKQELDEHRRTRHSSVLMSEPS